MYMRILRFIGKSLFVLFALVGLAFTSIFVGMHFGLTNVRGSIASRNQFFVSAANAANNVSPTDIESLTTDSQILCSIHALAKYAPETASNIQYAWQTTQDVSLVQEMLSSAELRFLDSTNISSDYHTCTSVTDNGQVTTTQTAYSWADSPEWQVLSAGLLKDQSSIAKASQDSGVPARMIASVLIPEQFRFFTSDRDSFKQYFEPLKVLGTLSQFSLGVSGIKPETALQIEENLTNSSSPYYLGPSYEHLLDYPSGVDHDTELYSRLTDTTDHYYQYLYTALYIKEIETQWQNAGYPINNHPEIVATLFNLGFDKSVPKPDPVVAGSDITVGGDTYTFGQLGYEFYYSGELSQFFPYSD